MTEKHHAGNCNHNHSPDHSGHRHSDNTDGYHQHVGQDQHQSADHAHLHGDGHVHHNHGGCIKMHGSLQTGIEKGMGKILDRISNRKAQKVAALMMRLGSLAICPGDDIAAIGLQVYGSISGHMSGVEEHQEYAVLPRRPGINFDDGSIIIEVPFDQLPERA